MSVHSTSTRSKTSRVSRFGDYNPRINVDVVQDLPEKELKLLFNFNDSTKKGYLNRDRYEEHLTQNTINYLLYVFDPHESDVINWETFVNKFNDMFWKCRFDFYSNTQLSNKTNKISKNIMPSKSTEVVNNQLNDITKEVVSKKSICTNLNNNSEIFATPSSSNSVLPDLSTNLQNTIHNNLDDSFKNKVSHTMDSVRKDRNSNVAITNDKVSTMLNWHVELPKLNVESIMKQVREKLSDTNDVSNIQTSPLPENKDNSNQVINCPLCNQFVPLDELHKKINDSKDNQIKSLFKGIPNTSQTTVNINLNRLIDDVYNEMLMVNRL